MDFRNTDFGLEPVNLCMEIRADSALQILRFAHIDDNPVRIIELIRTRFFGHCRYYVLEVLQPLITLLFHVKQ